MIHHLFSDTTKETLIGANYRVTIRLHHNGVQARMTGQEWVCNLTPTHGDKAVSCLVSQSG
ncbi:hypothetical protein K2D_00450 [Planctomycetes bacterium K2D]|uniref:Uncharacterized protein n=1 Tax=Botrimarina mediterranea TaxID=2528022 RepID=A0A518K289_9BACT|nr:hypothetical protein Spa11_00950 [Botrimarina mediterranea]QDV76467.1 hypothetical protein K2D_00450 [Planctomycetes bacterium K2D]